MNQQPDTSTLDGKIAVMEACKTKRIQWKYLACRLPENGWQPISKPLWNWQAYEYRIHPDDLSPSRVRPWTLEEVPVGAIVQNKSYPQERTMITRVSYKNGEIGIWISSLDFSPIECLRQWQMLDGSPCGIVITSD